MTADEVMLTLMAWALGWDAPDYYHAMMVSDALEDLGRIPEAQIMRRYMQWYVSLGGVPTISRARSSWSYRPGHALVRRPSRARGH